MGLEVIKRTSASELALVAKLSSKIKSDEIPAELAPMGAQILVIDVEETQFTNRDGEAMVNVYLATKAGNVFIKSEMGELKSMSIGGSSKERRPSNLDWMDREVVLWSKEFCDAHSITKGCLLEGVKIVSKETTETPIASSPEYQKQPLKEPRLLADGTYTQDKQTAYSVDRKPIYKTVVIVPIECTGSAFQSYRVQREAVRTTSFADLTANAIG